MPFLAQWRPHGQYYAIGQVPEGWRLNPPGQEPEIEINETEYDVLGRLCDESKMLVKMNDKIYNFYNVDKSKFEAVHGKS